jgi:hypothetical protein
MITTDDLLEMGFKPIPHFTIGNTYTYDLGRRRDLSMNCVGTPNEMLFICEIDEKNKLKITDIICLHNYDYDGYITKEKLKTLINCIGIGEK